MSVNFHVIIPARYQSSRLPGKLMKEIAGKTVIERVYEQVLKSKPKSLLIATDNDIIANHAKSFGAEVVMTSSEHQTGTDRIAEVIKKNNFLPDDIIVNVQGDEPFIAPTLITQLANILHASDAPVATLCWPIESLEQFNNPNVVKVVRDRHNHALYFSRSAIPAHRDDATSISHAFRHIGIYGYRANFVLDYVNWPVCALETCEALEQLRIMHAGYKIRVDVACAIPQQDINTQEDLLIANQLFSKAIN